MDSSAQANFKWKGPDGFSHVGDSVHITNPETKDLYFCTATNEVSEETAEFKLTDCPGQGSEKFATGSTQTLSVNAERALKFIEWKHKGNLVVEWYGEGDPTQYRYNAKLNTNTGDLTFKMLKVNSGEYKCQYQYKDKGTFDEKVFQVEVIDPVSKPKVTCKKNATDITLTCTIGSSVPAEFTWTGPNGFSHVGNIVHITSQETNNSLYFCTAQNEVSKETAEFTLMNCYKGGNKGPTFLYWLIPLISIFILILAVIAKRCYSKGAIPTNSNQEPDVIESVQLNGL
ncbi:hypothetical protein HF521_016338 [Silurus meridionalis]|uniref:Ig-like domain-containing protein n=1 Tax=Silurus meridionalis TaxID=175797 RepID=A0A8T0BR18_SILME|nr:hypothetical protein HF521_016338 [Silurus meridionalis]